MFPIHNEPEVRQQSLTFSDYCSKMYLKIYIVYMLINDPKIEFIERLQMLKRIDPFHIYFQQLYHHGNGTVAVFMFTCKCTNLRAVT